MSAHTLASPASAPGSAHLHPEEAAGIPAAKAATDKIHRIRMKPTVVCIVCVCMHVRVLQLSVWWHLGPFKVTITIHHYKSEITHILAWLKFLQLTLTLQPPWHPGMYRIVMQILTFYFHTSGQMNCAFIVAPQLTWVWLENCSFISPLRHRTPEMFTTIVMELVPN